MWQVIEQSRVIREYIQKSPYRCISISIRSSPTLRQVGDLGDGWGIGNKCKYFDESNTSLSQATDLKRGKCNVGTHDVDMLTYYPCGEFIFNHLDSKNPYKRKKILEQTSPKSL